MNGLGYFIWNLKTIAELYTPEALAKLLKQANTGWVTWKISDGVYSWNQIPNEKLLIDYMRAFEAVGIENTGWGYSYGNQSALEGATISNQIKKFQARLAKFDAFFLDIEVEWKGRPDKSIESLLSGIKAGCAIGFCSYRFPNLHSEIGYKHFFESSKVKFNAPQVYWMGSHNVSAQLDESYQQYAAITNKPFLPIGAAWGQTVKIDGKDVYWEVTEDDLKAFVARCHDRGWNTYGFWSLDWILSHNKLNWLEAIGGAQVDPTPTPTPEPEPEPEPTPSPGPAPVVQYRVCHDREYQAVWRKNVPEVFHFDQARATKLTKEWQKFILELNPGMTKGEFRSLLKWDRAFTNGTGFDKPGGPPRADFINGKNLGANPPMVDKARVCGGAIIRGTLKGNTLTVETLDGSKPPPSVEYVRAHPWLYFRAITVLPDGSNGEFPQNSGRPVYFPLVASGPVTVMINKIVKGKPYPYIVMAK